ncbi:AI-2E family transporter [Cellulomonas bogoriensis]|uniref:Membrane protein n=1 Tax=Cellulomonas bogoriensis 69B4 = DSM 16987 TaxID=1386082 RepID=A0A0A0BWS9_9CELL|nr:AI-2E family transporter [Cellulomonas bogoriensis]KGM12833.1 membrane protein [Cellulomonas bogoriensis 69B4 = DSM 16987]
MRTRRRERPSLWTDGLGRAAVRSAQVLLVLALVMCALWALGQISVVVIAVLIATIVAAAVSPVVSFLRHRGIPSGLATWFAMFLGAGGLGLVIWFVVNAVRDEWDDLVDSATEGFDELQQFLTQGPLGITDEQIDEARQEVADLLTSDAVQSGAMAGAATAVEIITGIVLGIVVLFFLLRDSRRIWGFFLRPFDAASRERADRIGGSAVNVLGGYVRGTAIVAAVDATVIGVALFILGIPLALPLATIVFLGAFIPLLGATLAGTLAALVALVAEGPVYALIVVGVVIGVNQLEGNLLEPIVLGRTLSLHPLAILLALTAGTLLAGIIGALLSVPLAAVAWAVISQWNAADEVDGSGGEDDDGEDDDGEDDDDGDGLDHAGEPRPGIAAPVRPEGG